MAISSAQIVQDATVIAKCPGYLALAGRQLNLVLKDLVMHRNLKVNLVTDQIILPPNNNGPFPLELNYLRTYDLWFSVEGEPFFLNPCSLKEFDMEFQQNSISNYPYEWATDLSPVGFGLPGLLYVYPQASQQQTLTHRYYLNQLDIVSPEAYGGTPWFSDQDYLINATAMRLMRITDDPRYTTYVADCEKLLEKHLLTEGDEQQVVKEVQLDPRRFRIGGALRPTKIFPW